MGEHLRLWTITNYYQTHCRGISSSKEKWRYKWSSQGAEGVDLRVIFLFLKIFAIDINIGTDCRRNSSQSIEYSPFCAYGNSYRSVRNDGGRNGYRSKMPSF